MGAVMTETTLNLIRHNHADPSDLIATLAALIANGNCKAAGQALHLTGSAVLARIKRLNERVGQPVAMATGTGSQTRWILTEAGRGLLEATR